LDTRDLTRARILQAALKEFGLHGYRGARLQTIARRAEVRRGLIAYYFGTKEELFRAVVRERVSSTERIQQQVGHGPDDPFAWTLSLFALGESTLDWVHLLIWESLEWVRPSTESDGTDLLLQSGRREFWERRIAAVRASQAAGHLPADVDAEQLTFFLWVMGLYPYLLPQIAYLITGHWPADEHFQVEFERFIREIATRLRRTPGSQEGARPTC
jgi:AcrR family transcriptional regulator